MNLFTIQGQLLYKEKPKRPGGSALIIVLIGRQKPETKDIITTVNKVIIRVPGRLAHVLDSFQEDDYVEINGVSIGRIYFTVGKRIPISTLNLVASGIQKCSVSHLVDAKSIERRLFGTFVKSGIVKAVQPPHKEGAPHTLFIQVERPIRRNEKEDAQPTAVIPIAVYDSDVHKLVNLQAQMAVVVTGSLRGILRKMPISPDLPGEMEERLEVGLVLSGVRQCAIIPVKIYETRRERDERLRKEKEAIAEASVSADQLGGVLDNDLNNDEMLEATDGDSDSDSHLDEMAGEELGEDEVLDATDEITEAAKGIFDDSSS